MSIYDHLDVPDLLIHFFLLPLVVDIETLSNSQPIVTYFLTFDPYSTNIWSPVVILSLHVTVYFIPDVVSLMSYPCNCNLYFFVLLVLTIHQNARFTSMAWASRRSLGRRSLVDMPCTALTACPLLLSTSPLQISTNRYASTPLNASSSKPAPCSNVHTWIIISCTYTTTPHLLWNHSQA